jgi:acyl-CoA thioesterase
MSFEQTLALRVVRKHRDGVTVHFSLRDGYLNSNGVLHGGVTAAIADEAAWHALIHAHQAHREMTTTELKVNYLRPMGGKKVRARAYVLRAGQKLGVTRVDLFDAQRKLSAVAIVTYMVLPTKELTPSSTPRS